MTLDRGLYETLITEELLGERRRRPVHRVWLLRLSLTASASPVARASCWCATFSRPIAAAWAGAILPKAIGCGKGIRLSKTLPSARQTALKILYAIDAKDAYTCGHSERVQIVASLLGEELGLEPRVADDLYWASLLHDVGKIGIPDAILLKPGAWRPWPWFPTRCRS